ncbi:MAG: T9SS type A sorting domain-containing protein [Bacteroidetes bacterium]|nr:T9SS type A sorting domain-containing protein [Bacteroidota bacterium]
MTRNYPVKIVVVFLFFLQITFQNSAFAALSGSYTIDAKSGASSTNYKSLNAFVEDLQTGNRTDGGPSNGPGVSNAVNATLVSGSGPYSEQITIGPIAGVSASNTITIDGNGEMISFMPTNSDPKHVISLDSASYLTFKNLTVWLTNKSGGRNFHITGHTNHCVIEHCTLSQSTKDSIEQSAFIAMSGDKNLLRDVGTVPGYEMTFRNNTLTNDGKCAVNYGIYLGYMINDTGIYKNRILHNSIRDFTGGGIYGLATSYQEIIGNEVFENRPALNSKLIYLQCDKNRMVNTIDSNYIHDFSQGNTAFVRAIEIQSAQAIGGGNLSIRSNRIEATGLFRQPVGNQVCGVYIYMYQTKVGGDVMVHNNTIKLSADPNNNNVALYGIQMNLVSCTGIGSANTSGNNIRIANSANYFGIHHYVYASKLTDTMSVISNNIVQADSCFGGTAIYGITFQTGLGIYYNTIAIEQFDTNFAFVKALYVKSDKEEVYNNMIYAKCIGASVFGIEFSGVQEPKIDYNCIFFESKTQEPIYALGGIKGTAVGFDSFLIKYSGGHDISFDPQFADYKKNDLTPTDTNVMNAGIPLARITTDIFGLPRDSFKPDMGAIETMMKDTMNDDTTTNDTTIGIPKIFVDDVWNFNVYPNPANDQIFISRTNSSSTLYFTLFNLQGEAVGNFEIKEGRESMVYKLPDLCTGVYILTAESDSGITQRRLRIM